jgi:hypothetical protein
VDKEDVIHTLGYTDSELELKVAIEGCDSGGSLWVYWPSELYSVGRLYRELAWYPKILPLFFYGDHGIHPTSELAKHEVDNDSNVHFTFNPERAIQPITGKKKIYLFRHPWVDYRKKKKYEPIATAKGTLVFISHSTPSVEWVENDRDGYFAELKKLPEKYKPLVLCMHMHDINKKHHLQYRKYNLPIVTCGNTSSIHFVDEFYKLTTQFKFASSNTAGSQLYYCIEMGMPYFLFGDTPKLLNKSDKNLPLGVYEHKNEIAKQIHVIEQKIFSGNFDEVTLEQKIFTEWILGFGSNMSRFRFALIVWWQLLRNTTRVTTLAVKIIVKKILKLRE